MRPASLYTIRDMKTKHYDIKEKLKIINSMHHKILYSTECVSDHLPAVVLEV